MSLNYKKSKLVESMGYNQVLPTFYGKTPQNIKLTELQFKRLVEGYMDDEDKELKEMNFGDEEGDNLPAGVNFDTENLNEFQAPGEFSAGIGADEESYGKRRFKKSVIGVDDDNIDKKSREGEVYEDSGAEESYHDDENIHHDVVDLHRLEKDGASEEHIHDLLDDIHDDEKHGVGKDDEWRDLAGSDFYHDKGMGESVDLNGHLNSLKEYVKNK